MDYHQIRATVMGLGHFGGGVAAARWLAEQGARVTATDLASRAALADALASLDSSAIDTFHLGGHREDDFRHADLVVVNPAVRPDNPFLRIARQNGVQLTTEIGLFLENARCSMVGVTGSNGKSTTAAMIAEILKHDGRRVWLGGNLGGSLLGNLEEIREDHWAVLELSSFQLAHLPPATVMPSIAVVTNCTPNHLDWHGDWSNYVAAKQRLLAGLPDDGQVVLGGNLGQEEAWRRLAGKKILELVAEDRVGSLQKPGKHNRDNALCAATAALAAGCSQRAIDEGLRAFTGLPGRLQRIATIDGRDFYNDTTATTPESTIAALGALEGPVWLLAGGGEKGIDLEPLVDTIAASACGVAFYGKVGPKLYQSLVRRSTQPESACCATLDEALRWCWHNSRPGQSIVLSPACTSHDQFQNFQQRGETFARLVASLAKQRESLSDGSSDD